MDTDLEEIGRRLRDYLTLKKIGINQLGRMINSSGAQVSNIINGKNYGIKKFIAIGNACSDLNLLWLLTGKGEMFSPTHYKDIKAISIQDSEELQHQVEQLSEEKRLLSSKIEALVAQKRSLEGAISYQELAIEAYKNSLSVVSASNQDLREMLHTVKNIIVDHTVRDNSKKTA